MDVTNLCKKLILLGEEVVDYNSFGAVIKTRESSHLYKLYKLNKNGTVDKNILSKIFRGKIVMKHFILTYNEVGKLELYIQNKGVDLLKQFSWPTMKLEDGIRLPELLVNTMTDETFNVKSSNYTGRILAISYKNGICFINSKGNIAKAEIKDNYVLHILNTLHCIIHHNEVNGDYTISIELPNNKSYTIGTITEDLEYSIDEAKIIDIFSRKSGVRL